MNDSMIPKLPYKGLAPYSENDAPFFFGRDAERRIITANLRANRLTLLYGASGVGKSSVLHAGVIHGLHQLGRDALGKSGKPRSIVVAFGSWRDDPVAGLKASIQQSVAEEIRTISTPAFSLSHSLVDSLQSATEYLSGQLLIILDQFEEYFLYHENEDGDGSFAIEFPRAINQADLRVNFLISIREDSLSRLDRFKGRITSLFNNYLRVEPMREEAARDAIVRPVDQYNRLIDDPSSYMSVEIRLVDQVIKQVRSGQVFIGDVGQGQIFSQTKADQYVETPYLQLVMTRLWNEEIRNGSRILRLETLQRLGGAQRIVQTHLDEVMTALSWEDRDNASRVFNYLVTPTGTKIAYTVQDLAEYSDVDEDQLSIVLNKLSHSDVRVLRTIAPVSGSLGKSRFEIFHDVLAPAILDWRKREAELQRMRKRADALEERLRPTSIELAEAGDPLSFPFDLRANLNIGLNQVFSKLSVDAADILLLNESMKMLEYAAGRGFETNAIQQTRLKLRTDSAGLAAEERKAIVIPDLRETASDSRLVKLLANEKMISYIVVPLIMGTEIKGVLEIFYRVLFNPDSKWLNQLESIAKDIAVSLGNATLVDQLQRSNVELALAYDAMVEGWSRALDLRDKETEGHTLRVTEITLQIARGLGMSEMELIHVRRGALLHDMGKMAIPDAILLKSGPLTDEEWQIMRKHPTYAYELLAPIHYLRPALDIPYCHHEKWDGTGFPRGLKGEQIPLAARAFAAADVWDALRSDRPYRLAWSEETVRTYIRQQAGTHFDPRVVEVFMKVLEKK